MKAVTVVPGTAGTARLDDVPEPEEPLGSVVVEALAAGICGTDLEIANGSYGWPPPDRARLTLGHESLGRVLDPGSSGFSVGEHVVGIVRRPDPLPCPNCAVGEWDMCSNGGYTERGIKQVNGFMSERWRIEPDYAIRVDKELGLLGDLLEPTTVVEKAWEQIITIGQRTFWDPQTVVVVGAGPIGLLAAPAPIRTLARAARLMRDARSWEHFGLHGDPPRLDITEALASAQRVANFGYERRRLDEFLRQSGIELVQGVGPAVFHDPHTIRIGDGRTFASDAIVVAVGGRARRLPIPGAEFGKVYDDVRRLTEVPRSAAIIGGSDTGCQIASILADFGVSVTIFEGGPVLASRADHDISRVLGEMFVSRGIDVKTSTAVQALEKTAEGIAIDSRCDDQPSRLTVDDVFFAAGWPGNADTLEVERIGLDTYRGYIQVGESLRSNIPHILAAGDINGISMLVPSARYEGRIAAENAVLGTDRISNHDTVPTGSFTDPEFGSVGLTEAQAKDYNYETAIMRYDDMLRPVADGRPEGFCKLIVERKHRYLLGAHVIGEYSAEVIQMAAACMAGNMRIEQIANLHPAFPTFTEAVVMAAQKIVRQLRLAPMAPSWSELRLTEPAPAGNGTTSSQSTPVA